MPWPDEAFLLAAWEHGTDGPPSHRALTLLAAGLDRDGAELARVDVGTREVLLARMLARVAGAVVWACTACSGCGGRLDVPVDVAAIALMPVHRPGETFEVPAGGGRVGFRLPTTADLEALSGTAPDQGRRRLLRQCVSWPDRDAPEEISEEVAQAVEAAMEAASPAGAIEVTGLCPDCGTATSVALDLSVLLQAHVEAHARAVLQDVHALAHAYGWSEPDILALSPRRRAAYLDLVSP